MFGKGGGALSTWIRELCQLIFIQTIQAFIYAIIITLIMNLYGESVKAAAGADPGHDFATGLGLFSIIALLSVYKVEDIARKIFGFGPTKADHGSAVRSIAKTAFALKLGSRVLDNGKKVIGGAKAWLGGSKDEKKAADRLNRRKQALLKDNESDAEVNKPSSVVGTEQSAANEERKKLLEKKERMLALAARTRARASSGALPDELKQEYIEKANQLEGRARGIDETLATAFGGGQDSSASVSQQVTAANATPSASSNRSGSGKSSNYYQSLLNMQEQYEDEIKKAKNRRKEGFRTMTRGLAETGGAIIGGTTGAILGMASGEFDDAVNGLVSGAGLGDAAGAGAANLTFGAADLVDGAIKGTGKAVKDYSSAIKEQYEAEKAEAVSMIKDANRQAEKEVSRINKNYEKARADLENEINLSVGQTAKAMAKATGKGVRKAYRSRHGGIRELESGLNEIKTNLKNMEKDVRLDNNVESID